MSGNMIQGAYKEVMACRLAARDEDGYWECGHDGPCDWTFLCSLCGHDMAGGPCPDHTPEDIPGLRLVECGAEPRHARTWLTDDDGFGPPCPWCVIDAAGREHEGCEHASHGRWRRSRAVHRFLSWGYGMGFVGSYGSSYGGGCRGCVAGVRWGRSSYLAGWPRWKWRCLLKARHWPGEEVLDGMCGKCCPCPDCGSQHAACKPGCPAVPA